MTLDHQGFLVQVNEHTKIYHNCKKCWRINFLELAQNKNNTSLHFSQLFNSNTLFGRVERGKEGEEWKEKGGGKVKIHCLIGLKLRREGGSYRLSFPQYPIKYNPSHIGRIREERVV